jgi:hypothetical protein
MSGAIGWRQFEQFGMRGFYGRAAPAKNTAIGRSIFPLGAWIIERPAGPPQYECRKS